MVCWQDRTQSSWTSTDKSIRQAQSEACHISDLRYTALTLTPKLYNANHNQPSLCHFSSRKMPPSCQSEGNKARTSEFGHSELISEDDARHESDISGPQESEEPRQKRPRYSVQLKSNSKFDETYHPSIAEKIKLRERKHSQSYDETQQRSFQGKEIKKSPRHLTSNLYHPYREKVEGGERGGGEEGSPAKIFIQIPVGTEKKTLLTNKSEGTATPSDRNHNKLSESEMFLPDSSNVSQVYPVQLRPPSTDPDSPQVR